MPFRWREEHKSEHCSPAALQGWDRKQLEECGLEHSPTKGQNPGHTGVQEKNALLYHSRHDTGVAGRFPSLPACPVQGGSQSPTEGIGQHSGRRGCPVRNGGLLRSASQSSGASLWGCGGLTFSQGPRGQQSGCGARHGREQVSWRWPEWVVFLSQSPAPLEEGLYFDWTLGVLEGKT